MRHKVWTRQSHETTRQLKLGNVTVESGGCLEMLDGSEVWDGKDSKLQKCRHGAMAGRGGCAMCVDARRQEQAEADGYPV